ERAGRDAAPLRRLARRDHAGARPRCRRLRLDGRRPCAHRKPRASGGRRYHHERSAGLFKVDNVKRLCLLLLAGLLVASAPAAADDTPTPTTIPAGVTINGVDVGGMTAEVASAAVLEAFQQPLHLQVGSTEVLVTPDVLGATPVVDRAIQRALVAQPNTAVSLGISIVRSTTGVAPR